MEWISPFIVYRLNIDSKLEEVYHCAELKMAKYWLSYIGQVGDVLCRTPAHPKHSKTKKTAEYWQHKGVDGKLSSDESDWIEFAKTRNCDLKFPEGQLVSPK